MIAWEEIFESRERGLLKFNTHSRHYKLIQQLTDSLLCRRALERRHHVIESDIRQVEKSFAMVNELPPHPVLLNAIYSVSQVPT
jgi:hypothetical protein